MSCLNVRDQYKRHQSEGYLRAVVGRAVDQPAALSGMRTGTRSKAIL